MKKIIFLIITLFFIGCSMKNGEIFDTTNTKQNSCNSQNSMNMNNVCGADGMCIQNEIGE